MGRRDREGHLVILLEGTDRLYLYQLFNPVKIARNSHVMLDLLRSIHRHNAFNGQFGCSEPELTWERTDKAAVLRLAAVFI